MKKWRWLVLCYAGFAVGVYCLLGWRVNDGDLVDARPSSWGTFVSMFAFLANIWAGLIFLEETLSTWASHLIATPVMGSVLGTLVAACSFVDSF